MSKELTSLEAVEKILNEFVEILLKTKCVKPTAVDIAYLTNSLRVVFHSELDIIETALKRLEEHDKIFKKYDINDIWLEPLLYVIKNHFPMDTETQLKKLKVLEIIKRNPLMVCADYCKCIAELKLNYQEYLKYFSNEEDRYIKNEEDYDLLREVLL